MFTGAPVAEAPTSRRVNPRALATLVDTRDYSFVASAMAGMSDQEIRLNPYKSFARGRLLVMADSFDESLSWFFAGLRRVGPSDHRIASRLAFETGCVLIRRGEEKAAVAILERTEGALGPQADLFHLRALLREQEGRAADAVPLYRESLRRSSRAHSQVTAVLALRNLAALEVQSDPEGSVAQYNLALDLVRAYELDDRLRPSLLNALGYALVSLGEIERAREVCESALEAASRFGMTRVAVCARFNRAIANELLGEASLARRELEGILGPSEHKITDVQGWARIRLAWLEFSAGNSNEAASRLSSWFPEPIPELYGRSVETLRALIALDTEPSPALRKLRGLIASYTRDGDSMTAFALILWLGYGFARQERRLLAGRTVKWGLRIGRARGLRLSPNWWSAGIVQCARELALDSGERRYADSLVVREARRDVRPVVRSAIVVSGQGDIFIDGSALEDGVWSEGRAGPRVLHRLLSFLAIAYPNSVSRDQLADRLWPDSDGDRAIRNLYGATRDLRRLLLRAPGVGLSVRAGAYSIQCRENAHVLV